MYCMYRFHFGIKSRVKVNRCQKIGQKLKYIRLIMKTSFRLKINFPSNEEKNVIYIFNNGLENESKCVDVFEEKTRAYCCNFNSVVNIQISIVIVLLPPFSSITKKNFVNFNLKLVVNL